MPSHINEVSSRTEFKNPENEEALGISHVFLKIISNLNSYELLKVSQLSPFARNTVHLWKQQQPFDGEKQPSTVFISSAMIRLQTQSEQQLKINAANGRELNCIETREIISRLMEHTFPNIWVHINEVAQKKCETAAFLKEFEKLLEHNQPLDGFVELTFQQEEGSGNIDYLHGFLSRVSGKDRGVSLPSMSYSDISFNRIQKILSFEWSEVNMTLCACSSEDLGCKTVEEFIPFGCQLGKLRILSRKWLKNAELEQVLNKVRVHTSIKDFEICFLRDLHSFQVPGYEEGHKEHFSFMIDSYRRATFDASESRVGDAVYRKCTVMVDDNFTPDRHAPALSLFSEENPDFDHIKTRPLLSYSGYTSIVLHFE